MSESLPKLPAGITGVEELNRGSPDSGNTVALRHQKTESSGAGPAVAAAVVMRLYVVDKAPNSLKAIANLAAICREYLQTGCELEIIDVLKFPLRALADGVLVTPSLAKVSPAPAAKIVGDLSDRNFVLHALGIRE